MSIRAAAKRILPNQAYNGARRIGRDAKWLFRRCSSIDVLPHTDHFDTMYHRHNFIKCFDREPSQDSMALPDYLYRLKTGPEILDPLRVRVSDKQFVKEYVREIVGDEYNVPTIAVLESFQEVQDFDFPQDCVIKPTHSSQEVYYRRNGEEIDYGRIEFWFYHNYYLHKWRERNYRSLQPKVIVEPFLFGLQELSDYKIFCFNGEPKLLQVHGNRYSGHTQACFDADWNLLPVEINFPLPEVTPERPGCLAEMLTIARKMSAEFSFIRVDLYVHGDEIRVGELTNLPEGGYMLIGPDGAGEYVSNLLFGST